MSHRQSPLSVRSAVRRVALLPLLLVGAMVYWSMALGLGGITLLAVSAMSGELSPELEYGLVAPDDVPPTAAEPVPGHVERITVQIQESSEPEDVNDNAGAATAFQNDR